MKVKIAISEPTEVTDPFITDLASFIAKSKRALVVTGAGISCSSGIPVRCAPNFCHCKTQDIHMITIGFSFS